MNKIFYILAIIFFTFSASSAQQVKKVGFTLDSAKAFFEASPNLNESAKEFKNKAISIYENGDTESAAELLADSKYFEILDKFGKKLSDEQKAYFLANSDVLQEFITILSPLDNLEQSFSILSDIWNIDSGASFVKFSRLALAIAIVFDSKPYLNWPHSQVNEEILPRALPNHVDAFNMWIEQRQKRRLIFPIERLSIEELKYLVASLANNEDREWVQRSVPVSIGNVEKLYYSVPYATERITAKAYNWTGTDYRLKTIRDTGGICTDQAYFTAEVAKCSGIPAFIFTGAGKDGFHAWAAYMVRPGVWNFDVGRYKESRFVTGRTVDPQTWNHATDHALESLREGFRRNVKYRSNQVHTMFAQIYFDDGNFDKAEAAARAAISQDSRNIDSWKMLIAASEKLNKNEVQIRSLYDNAIKAFSKYPDVDAALRKILIKSYNESGKEEMAQKLTTSIIIKTKASRPDIAMSFARAELEFGIATNSAQRLYSSYKRLLSNFKKDGAMAVEGIFIPIEIQLLNVQKIDEGLEVLKITRQVLKPEKNSTIAANIDSIENQLNAIKNADD